MSNALSDTLPHYTVSQLCHPVGRVIKLATPSAETCLALPYPKFCKSFGKSSYISNALSHTLPHYALPLFCHPVGRIIKLATPSAIACLTIPCLSLAIKWVGRVATLETCSLYRASVLPSRGQSTLISNALSHTLPHFALPCFAIP